MYSRLPLVGEITYNRGNEEFVGGRGNLREKRLQNRGNVGKCKGIDSKLSSRKSDKDKRSTLQHKVTEQVTNTGYSKLCSF